MLEYPWPPTPVGGLYLQAEEVFAEGPQVPGASLVSQLVKNLPAIQETLVQSLGWEDFPGEGNDSPLQYSCLENHMEGRACKATVQGITKNLTRWSNFTFTFANNI